MSISGMPRLGPVVIIEPNFNGHRMMYCRLITEVALSTSRKVILATSTDTVASAEFKAHLEGHVDQISVIDLGPLALRPNWGYQTKLLKQIDSIMAVHPTAEIIVLEGDKFVIPLAVHGTSHHESMTVLVMRAPTLVFRLRMARISDLLKQGGMWAALCRGVNIKVLAPALRADPPYTYRGYAAVPDPVDITSTGESIELYRSQMGLETSRVWVGVFGNISPRKNLGLVADAISKCDAEKYGLLVAGKISKAELSRCAPSLQRLRDAGASVVFDSRLLSDTELDSAIAAVQIAAIAHSSEGPSGILGKAVASGVAVAAAGAVSLKEDVDRLGAGAWSPLTAEDFAEALRRAPNSSLTENTELATGQDFASALLSAAASAK